MAIRISIIIPIYNAASTLQTAVESILAQEFEEMELLLVDDGSTDNTPSICHQLSRLDTRIRVISQKNAGICAARNRGLSVARGDYITFCDDDDTFLPGALQRLYETAEREQADIVRGNYQLYREGPDGEFREQKHEPGMICRMWQEGYSAFLQNSGPQFVWNALYRRQFLEGVRFDERCRYGLEDFIFNMTLYAKTDRAVYLPDNVYRHYEGAQSTSVCQTTQALRARIGALGPWMEAEHSAIQSRCPESERGKVWALRRAEAITFLMHQLRDANAPAALRRYAWRTLRKILSGYSAHALDFWQGTGQNKKKTAALLLYQLRMQGLYDLFTSKQCRK